MNYATTTIRSRLGLPSFRMTPRTRWAVALLFPLTVGAVWALAWQGHGARLGTIAGATLLGAILTSAVTDAKSHKIYNWVTYSAFLWAIVINLIAWSTTRGTVPVMPSFESAPIVGPSFLGGIGIGECLVGAGACFLVTLFGYDLSGGGAGDVKIATVIGALLGFHDGIFAVAYSYVVAALAIIAWSVWRHGPLALIKAAIRTIGRALGPLWPFPSTSEDHALLMKPVPLGPYFAIGTLLVALQLVPTQ